MKRSVDRILTTHTGSLPRPPRVQQLNQQRMAGTPAPEAAAEDIAQAVADAVKLQLDAGISVINDGEQGKVDWYRYVTERLTGFDGVRVPHPARSTEEKDFPEFFARPEWAGRVSEPSCTGPLAWKNFDLVVSDIERLVAHRQDDGVTELFMSAASPGAITNHHPNAYYKSHEAYLAAIADVMRREYEAIAAAGIIVQIDCPDLTMRHFFDGMSKADFKRTIVPLHIEALEHATRNIPADMIRMHVCFGAKELPHTDDMELRDFVAPILRARPVGMSIVGANGRHAFEWRTWRDLPWPAEKVLIVGVIDPFSNVVEHPQTVADRIMRHAQLVGPSNVIASVDCGFRSVDPRIVRAKLTSLAAGAELASRELGVGTVSAR